MKKRLFGYVLLFSFSCMHTLKASGPSLLARPACQERMGEDDLDNLIDSALEKKVISIDIKPKTFTPFQMALIRFSKPLLRLYLFSAVKYRVAKTWVVELFRKWLGSRQSDKQTEQV